MRPTPSRALLPILAAALAVPARTARAAEWAWELRGYGEARLFDYAGAESEPWELDLRVRPRLRVDYGRAGVVLEPEARYAFGRGDEAYEDVSDVVSVERAYLDLDLGRTQVVAGKQAVNWGSGIVFNPTDLFDDVYLREVWNEPTGHPGVRATFALSSTSDVVVLGATDGEYEEVLSAVRGRATFGTTDVALLVTRDPFRDLDMAGIDVKGEAKVGLWLEAAWLDPDDDSGYVRAVAGVDYTFDVRNGLYAALQYYHDGSGATEVAGYDVAALLRRERATLARDYATLTGRLAFDEDLTLATQTIANLDDGSVLLTAYGEWTRVPRITLSLGTTWLAGQAGGEFHPPETLDPRLPDAIVFAGMRYHF